MKKRSLLLTLIFMLTAIFNSFFPNSVKAYSAQDNKSQISNGFQRVVDYISTHNSLPNNYITKTQARKLGWESGESLWNYAPGKNLGGGVFKNYQGLLPESKGRVWHECDINYDGMSRGADRVVYSNDGLIYTTMDHYKTFTSCTTKKNSQNN